MSIENLGWVQAVIAGVAPPTNQMMLWFDENPGEMLMKRYDFLVANDWVPIGAGGTLGPTSGGTGITTYAVGDMLYGSAPNVLAKLAIGSNGQLLRVSAGGIPEWATISFTVTSGNSTSGFGANRIPHLDASSLWTSSSSFIRNANGDVALGHTSASARLHIRGEASSGATKAVLFENLGGSEIAAFYNNRKIVFGSGSAATDTDFTINAFNSGGATTDYTMKVIGTGGDNQFWVSNANAYTDGGVYISRTSTSNRAALTILGNGVSYLQFSANGAFVWNNTVAISGITSISNGGPVMGYSGDATYPGVYASLGNTSTHGFQFTKQTSSSLSSSQAGFPFFQVFAAFGGLDNTVGGPDYINFVKHAPTFNDTGSRIKHRIGYEYDPTITAMTGEHYAMLVKAGLTGWNLGATYPDAYMHLGPGDSDYAAFKMTNQGTDFLATSQEGAVEYITVGGIKILTFTRSGATREGVLVGNTGAGAPGTTAWVAASTTNYWGSAQTEVLCNPNTWFSVVGDDGVTYKIPAYT